MTQQRLLEIGDGVLSAYRWRAGQLYPERDFADDAEGLAAWDSYLHQNRSSIFSVLAAVAEESFRCEDVPPARGSDRKALLARRQAQHFPGNALQLAVSLQRQTSGRRDEKLLFTALARPDPIEAWLAPLARLEARLAGIYTAPFLAERLAGELADAAAAPRFLLVVLLRQGMHQMLFEAKRLRFSRFTAGREDEAEARARSCAAEATRVEQYLRAQRLLDADAALPVVVLLHPAQTPVFREVCGDSDKLSYRFADLAAVARRNALRTLPVDSCSDALFLHLMARRPSAAQYAPPLWRRPHQLGRLRQALGGGGVATLGACLLLGAWNLLELDRTDAVRARLQARVAAARQHQATLVAPRPARAVASATLAAVLARYDRLGQPTPTFEATLTKISAALQRNADVELERIEWRAAADESGASAASPAGAQAVVHARLPLALAGDSEAQFAAVEAFLVSLSAAGTRAKVQAWPAAIDPARSLSRSEAQSLAGTAPRFSLHLVQR